MSRRVVLVRHGRTAWNLEDRAQGWTDVPLDEVGLDQARACAPAIASYRPSILVTSDLARAAQTAALIADSTRLTPRGDARVREFDLGVRSGLLRSEYAAAYPREYSDWLAGVDNPVAGEETTLDVAARLRAAWGSLTAELPEGETAVVVSHGGVLKVLACIALGLDLDVRRSLRVIGNCHWIELIETDEGDRFRLAGYDLRAGSQAPDFTSADGVG